MKTKQQIAHELGITPQTLTRWMREKDIVISKRLIPVDVEIKFYEAMDMTYRSEKLKAKYGFK